MPRLLPALPAFFILMACTTFDSRGGDALPNPSAPPQVRDQFGQFIGTWLCQGFNRQADGSWQPSPGAATWSWAYALDGYAIQDVWTPSAETPAAAVGINLRTFNPETGKWSMVWATTNQPDFDYFSASMEEEGLVMRGEIPARGQRPAHLARITFHDIEAAKFSWKYEFSPPGDGNNWTEASRLECGRKE